MITGRARLAGSHVRADEILDDAHLTEFMLQGGEYSQLVPWLFAGRRPDLGATLQKGDILVAGENFGAGSSGEIVPLTLKAAGISCIVASSFARTFYRTGINLGILPIECTVRAREMDVLEIYPEEGKLAVNHTGRYTFRTFPPMVLALIREKGLLNYYRSHGTL